MKLMEERKTSVDIQSMWKRRSNAPGAEPEAKNAIFDFGLAANEKGTTEPEPDRIVWHSRGF